MNKNYTLEKTNNDYVFYADKKIVLKLNKDSFTFEEALKKYFEFKKIYKF